MRFPFWRRKRRDEELNEEIRAHLTLAEREEMESGQTRKEAQLAARHEFGNVTLAAEVTRDMWGWRWLMDLVQDLRFGVRMLAKTAGFTAVAILTLALGIGANTALFSVVNGVLLNPLPYPEPQQIVTVASSMPEFPESAIAYLDFRDWQRQNQTFSSMAAYRRVNFDLTGEGEAERVSGTLVSADFFPILGVKPVLGRTFTLEEDRAGAGLTAMISGGFWKRKFGSSPTIVGKPLNLDGKPYTVIGVLPANFYFSGWNFRLSDVYTSIAASDSSNNLADRRMHPGIFAIGRLKPGVSLRQAQADMDGVARNLAVAYPEADKNHGIVLSPLKAHMTRDVRPFLLMLLAAVGFVLLIACVNVANLLLARSTARQREFAIRAALGAGKARLVRQLLTESVLLAIAGGGLGLLLASWGTQAALKVLPETLPRASDVRIDPRVLLFTLAVSLLAGLLFGLAPSLKTSQSELHETLKEGGRGLSGMRHRTQSIFVVAEMALAVVLLIGAGLMIRSLARLWRVNPGFDAHNVLTLNVVFPPSVANAAPEQIRTQVRNLLSGIGSIPGVKAVSLMNGATPMNGDEEMHFWILGTPKPTSQSDMGSTLWYEVSPDYLKVMKISLLRGRFLSPQDDEHSARVAVIDEMFARQYLPNQDPIGQRINFAILDMPVEIVGVVGHVKQWGLASDGEQAVQAQLYTSDLQLPDSSMKFLARDNGVILHAESAPDAVIPAIRALIGQNNSDEVVYGFQTMDQIVSDTLAARRFLTILLAVFAALALALSSIGIYGVNSYVSGQRTHEIGVRLALGAQQGDVLKLVLGQGAKMALLGVGLGLVAAAGLARLVKDMLFGVTATDPLTFGGVAILLTLVALAACYMPARRAMRVDPIVALRYE